MKSADTEPEMKHSQRFRYLLKVCALSTATLTFPMLLFAGQNDQGQNNNDQGGSGQSVYSVPEGGPGILLVATTFGAVLLFGAFQRSRAKA
jgi:hypothetical protein